MRAFISRGASTSTSFFLEAPKPCSHHPRFSAGTNTCSRDRNRSNQNCAPESHRRDALREFTNGRRRRRRDLRAFRSANPRALHIRHLSSVRVPAHVCLQLNEMTVQRSRRLLGVRKFPVILTSLAWMRKFYLRRPLGCCRCNSCWRAARDTSAAISRCRNLRINPLRPVEFQCHSFAGKWPVWTTNLPSRELLPVP